MFAVFVPPSCWNSIMASYLLNTRQLLTKFADNCFSFALGAVRKKSHPPYHQRSGRPKRKGIHKQDGAQVTEGTVLAIQYDLRYCPGLNVGYGKRGRIYAKAPGKLVVTCEKTDFKDDNAVVNKWYPDRTAVLYKNYFHVIPPPQHQRFKLVDQI